MPVTAVNVTKYSLADWQKSQDPDGKMAHLISMLTQTNEIMNDIPFLEGNLPLGHQVSANVALPVTYTRRVNQGTSTSKTREAQFTETIAMFESRQEIDVKIADLNGNAGAYRASKQPKFVESMRQKVCGVLLYGNAGVSIDQFNGFMVRLASTTAGNGANVILAGGTGSDNASILLVVYGEDMVHGIFPKGSTSVGLSHKDLGEIDAFDSNSKRYRAYADIWNWDCGLAVPDWRWVVRIANIDISNLVSKNGAADLLNLMLDAIYRLPGGWAGLQMGTAVFYMNRTVMKMLDVQKTDRVISGGGLNFTNVDGRQVVDFRGIPVRVVDQMLETETLVA